MRTLVAVPVLLAVVAPVAYAQQSDVIPFDRMFPPASQQEMGLHKLTDAEREALRKHVQVLLFSAVRAKSWTIQNRPPVQQPARPVQPVEPQAPKDVYLGLGGGHWIKQNIGRGEFILLEDGSLWGIDPFDRLDATLWLTITSITVLKSSKGSPGYGYLLVNTDDGERAHAKYMGNK